MQPQFSSVQSLSHVRLFATPWTAAHQASLSITNSWSPPKPMSIESLMPSNHLILCCPLLLLPSIFPSIRVFSNESALRIKWPKCWSFSFNISPSNEHPGLIYILLFTCFWNLTNFLTFKNVILHLKHYIPTQAPKGDWSIKYCILCGPCFCIQYLLCYQCRLGRGVFLPRFTALMNLLLQDSF